MNDLQKRINDIIENNRSTGSGNNILRGLKSGLNQSSLICENAVDSLSHNIRENIDDNLDGVAGAVSGWMVGTSVKIVGGIAGGVISGSLKFLADIIPDRQTISKSETDRQIADCINTFVIPIDKQKILELLQFSWSIIQTPNNPFGPMSSVAFKSFNSRAYKALINVCDASDKDLITTAKKYTAKKRFGFLK